MAGVRDVNPGAELHRYADYVTRESDGTGQAGMAVTLNNQGQVTLAGNGDNVFGILYTSPNATPSDDVTVKIRGDVKARVPQGTSVDTRLGAPGSKETKGVLGTSDTQDYLTTTDAVQGEDGNYYAGVLIR